MSIAWIFPGQGSQKLGMAEDLLSLPGAQKRFQSASELLGRNLLEICRGGHKEDDQLTDLNDTRNTQPALFVVESLLVDDLRRQGRKPTYVAGHSLGEIVALYSAEVFDFDTALSLLKNRSELMAEAAGGAMTAVIGFDRQKLETLVEDIEGVVIANDNSEAQVVLSGSPEGVTAVTTSLGCKRAIPLNVSGAFHSPYMANAAKTFAMQLDQINFNKASIPVLSNSDPIPSCDPHVLKQKLKSQMISGVRWRETMEELVSRGINTLVEIGPGNVLSGLAKRSYKDLTISQLSSASDLGH